MMFINPHSVFHLYKILLFRLNMSCSTDIRTQFWRRALQRGTGMGVQQSASVCVSQNCMSSDDIVWWFLFYIMTGNVGRMMLFVCQRIAMCLSKLRRDAWHSAILPYY